MEPNSILQLEAAMHDVLDTRYLSVAGLTLLLWDHCLTFEQERKHVWPAHPSPARIVFLANRYIVPIVLIVQTFSLSGLNSATLSDSYCWVSLAVSAIIGVLSMAVSHGLVLLKILKLWEGQTIIALAITLVYFITESGSVIFMVMSVSEEWPGAMFEPRLHMCIITHKPKMLPGVWACTVTLELVAFLLVCLNALNRPRRGDTFFMGVLYRDGMFLFLAISALGWLNLVISVTAPASRILIGTYCIWALITTIVSRMILNVQEAEDENYIPLGI